VANTWGNILGAVADSIRAVMATSDLEVQVEPRMILNPTCPSIDVFPGDPAREHQAVAMDDYAGSWLVTVRARIHTADHASGQDVLLSFMDDVDDLSVAAAVLDNPTLDGYASSIDLTSLSGYMLFPTIDGSGVHLGAQWVFTIIPAYS
jgi:hypothetical protein